jgi:hypothetical protein
LPIAARPVRHYGIDNESRDHCDPRLAWLAIDVASWEVTQRSMKGAAYQAAYKIGEYAQEA